VRIYHDPIVRRRTTKAKLADGELFTHEYGAALDVLWLTDSAMYRNRLRRVYRRLRRAGESHLTSRWLVYDMLNSSARLTLIDGVRLAERTYTDLEHMHKRLELL
jgi:transposase